MIIDPIFTTLSNKIGTSFELGISPNAKFTQEPDCCEFSRKAEVSIDNKVVTVSEASKGAGVWVPYFPMRATYGFSVGRHHGWLGTGPFSGCRIAFFTKGGRVGMAHIAKEGSNDMVAEDAWNTFSKASDVNVLNKWKVPMPDQVSNKFSASYLFLDLSDQKSVSLTQVDVHVRVGAVLMERSLM